MATSQKFSLAASHIALWINANPTATRVAMVALPIGLALAAAILGHQPVAYACPSPSGSGSCGG